ncbi:MAG: HNH endonuclease [Cyanobacteria bacterium SIG26]|nr:HNH endonuclease [Cyanobacteria bacterium SIG26]
MRVKPVEHKFGKPKPYPVSFGGYNFPLKKLFRQGKLPKDLIDIGGNKITQENLSGDHIIPKSKGGKCTKENMMIATKQFNNLRGNRDLKEVVTLENAIKWANKYFGIKVEGFDGTEHVKDVFKALDIKV